MDTQTHRPTLYERQPHLKLTREQLREKNARLRATLQRFMDGDAAEQKETGDILMNALAEARESNREEPKK